MAKPNNPFTQEYTTDDLAALENLMVSRYNKGTPSTPSNDMNQQPFQTAQRNQGSSIPGIGILQQLLGREAAPTLPPIQQVPTEQLMSGMDEAMQNQDMDRMRALRRMIELRSPQQQQPQQQVTSAQTPQQSSVNPFSHINEALRQR